MSQVVLYPCIVTYMEQAAPGGNYGTLNRFNVGASGKTDSAMRALMRIDLNLIGAATIADTSKLELYDTGLGTAAGGETYYASLVLQTAWTEEGANWTFYDGANGWDGLGCGTEGTDWDKDFASVSPALGAQGWQEFTGATLQGLLQEIIDNRSGILDIIIHWRQADGTPYENADSFSHYDSDDSASPISDTRPKLTIDYANGDVPNIKRLPFTDPNKSYKPHAYWPCVKTIAGVAQANVKKLASISEH